MYEIDYEFMLNMQIYVASVHNTVTVNVNQICLIKTLYWMQIAKLNTCLYHVDRSLCELHVDLDIK